MSPSLSATERRERARAYKQSFPAMGVYAVRCAPAGAVWLGASHHVDGTLNRIHFELRQGTHRHAAMAGAWRTHGPDGFVFEVLERVKQRDDPAFDHEAELQTLLALWQSELLAGEFRHE
jgi:hypothetical protein